VLFVVGAAGLALWHLPLDAAQEMSADELAEEFGYAAKSSCASLGDLWAAYKAQARHEGRRAA
jgi:hypothetical protein